MTVYALYRYQHRESGKTYVGVTMNLIRRHKDHAKGMSGARVFNYAVKKYGIDAFDFKVLALFDRADAACYHEQAAILKFNTLAPHGYNCTAGAPHTRYGGIFSDETRAKLSILRKGHVTSTETKAKISLASMGKIMSAEARAKMSLAATGRAVSDITRTKMSLASLGNTRSLGHHPSAKTRTKLSRAKMGNTNLLGHHPSDETRAKLSVALMGKNLGKHRTDEERAKISASRLGHHLMKETKKKIAVSMKGKQNSLGSHWSPEARANHLAAQKRKGIR